MPEDRSNKTVDQGGKDSPQVVRGSEGVTGAVRDRERRQPSLKDWLLSPKGRTEDLLAGGDKEIEITPVEWD